MPVDEILQQWKQRYEVSTRRIEALEREMRDHRCLLAALLQLFPEDREAALAKIREFETLLGRIDRGELKIEG